jgi:DNA-binding transcriptional MocR family regulator
VLIADKLREQIRQGHYAPGQRLPAEAELLEHHGVSLMTMRRSLAMLREEGLIATRRGVQAVVRVQPVRRTLTLGPGSRLIGRMPTAHERRALGMERGVPLLEIQGADGAVEVLSADQVEVVRPPSTTR